MRLWASLLGVDVKASLFITTWSTAQSILALTEVNTLPVILSHVGSFIGDMALLGAPAKLDAVNALRAGPKAYKLVYSLEDLEEPSIRWVEKLVACAALLCLAVMVGMAGPWQPR